VCGLNIAIFPVLWKIVNLVKMSNECDHVNGERLVNCQLVIIHIGNEKIIVDYDRKMVSLLLIHARNIIPSTFFSSFIIIFNALSKRKDRG
jgi:hypothetical protein